MSSDSPVFLAGSVRTGSTLLRLMLDAHPHITNPGECDFLFDLVDEKGRFPDVSEYRHWLSTNRIFQAKKLRIDPNLAYLDLMQSFLEQFRREGAVLSMNVHRHFNRIPYVFPDARYIHLLRDPRDVARSCIGMGWVGNVYYGVDFWQEAENSWDQLKSSLRDDQYMEIKYEDLLQDVKSGLVRICEFVGLEYSDQMMNYSSHTTYAPPDNKLIYQWKNKYSKRELQLVEHKVGKMLVARKYELSGYSPDSPRLFEAWKLAVQNKKYRVRFQIERYGLGLYLENFLASRSGLRFWMDSCQKRKNLIDLRFLK
jgi:Sulfotransferase family